MRRKDAKDIGSLIRTVLRQQGLESPLNEQKLMKAWLDLSPTIKMYTKNLFIKNQVLYVHLSSSVLRQELMMGRKLLIANLNKTVGATVITNIVLR